MSTLPEIALQQLSITAENLPHRDVLSRLAADWWADSADPVWGNLCALVAEVLDASHATGVAPADLLAPVCPRCEGAGDVRIPCSRHTRMGQCLRCKGMGVDPAARVLFDEQVPPEARRTEAERDRLAKYVQWNVTELPCPFCGESCEPRNFCGKCGHDLRRRDVVSRGKGYAVRRLRPRPAAPTLYQWKPRPAQSEPPF